MKTIEETLLNRTSVRRYEYDKIPSETLDFIYRAIAIPRQVTTGNNSR